MSRPELVAEPQPAPPTARAGRPKVWLPGIEAMRGVAAAMVVVHHMWSLSAMPRFPGYQIVEGFGTLGVTLFFMLSGYLLADGFWKPRAQRSYREYWIRRFFRIAPAYYLTVVILFLFFAEHSILFSEQGVRQIFANATFTHYLFPSTSSSLNVDGALWTLSAEMMLYLLLPAMALPFVRWPKSAFIALVALGVGWRLFVALAGEPIRALYFGASGGPGVGIESLYLARQFIGILPVFAVGIALKWLAHTGRLDRVRMRLPRSMSLGMIVLALIPPILMLFYVERASSYERWIWFSGYDLFLAVLLVPVLVLASQPTWTPTNFAHTAATWLGDRSYSLYIWHFPIILSVYGRGPLTGPPPTDLMVWRVALIVILSLVAAHLSFTYVERPGIEFGRRIATRFKRTGVSSVSIAS